MSAHRCTRGWAWCDHEEAYAEAGTMHTGREYRTAAQDGGGVTVVVVLRHDEDPEAVVDVGHSAAYTPRAALALARDIRRAARAAQGSPWPAVGRWACRAVAAVGRWLTRATGVRLVRVRWVEVDPLAERLPNDNVAAFEMGRSVERHMRGGQHPAGRRLAPRPSLRVLRDGPPDDTA